MKKRVLLALLAVAVALVAILCFTVPGAAIDAEEPSLSIYGKSLALKDGVYINYYVKVEGADESLAKNVKMLFFTAAPGADGYTVGNPDGKSADHSGYDEGTGCYVVRYTELTIKQMTDVIYSVAYLDTGDGIVYSAPCKYSIAQYAYNKAGDATEGALVKEMMELGGAAQERFDYHTDDLASATHYMVRLTGATFEDGFDFGLYPAGATVTVTAPETDAEGNAFVCWMNASEELVSEDRTYTFTVRGNVDLVVSAEAKEPPAGPEDASAFNYFITANQGVSITGYKGNRSNLIIPATIEGYPVTRIENAAFRDNTEFVSVTIPSSVTSIGVNAFDGCSSLESITIPDSVTSIGDSAFGDCSNLQSVTFAENSKCASIGEWAFSGCSSLTSITIPQGVTSIGEYAFRSCSNLQSVTFAENSKCTSIGWGAFYYCSSLTSITIPNSVTSINYGAFSGCTSLKSITIPSGVTSIDDYAFKSCTKLTINCEATEKPSGWSSSWNSSGCPVVWGYTGEE